MNRYRTNDEPQCFSIGQTSITKDHVAVLPYPYVKQPTLFSFHCFDLTPKEIGVFAWQKEHEWGLSVHCLRDEIAECVKKVTEQEPSVIYTHVCNGEWVYEFGNSPCLPTERIDVPAKDFKIFHGWAIPKFERDAELMAWEPLFETLWKNDC